MYRLIAAVAALGLILSTGQAALAVEVANAPAQQAPEIRPFTSAHFAMSGSVKVDGITVDVLGEGDLAVPDRQRSSFKFGPFTDTNEHCNVFAFYYPAQGLSEATYCVKKDGVETTTVRSSP